MPRAPRSPQSAARAPAKAGVRRRSTVARLPAPASAPARRTAREAEAPPILIALAGEHRYQARLLKVLEDQAGLFNQGKSPDAEVMWGVMHYMTHCPDRYHHPKEDLIFDRVLQRDRRAATAIAGLREAHRSISAQGEELLALIEARRGEHPLTDPDRHIYLLAMDYVKSMREHMDFESMHFFPRAMKLLKPADWAEIDARMRPILDPVFGEFVAEEYQPLHRHYTESVREIEVGRLRAQLVEAVALIESLTAAIGGVRQAINLIGAHNRQARQRNRELLGRVLAQRSLRGLRDSLGRLRKSNLEMREEVSHKVQAALAAAGREALVPYDHDDRYGPRLLRRLVRRR